MPRGATNSPYRLSERREIAFEKFLKGWSNRDVAELLQVDADTVSRYRKEYQERLDVIARENPDMLVEVVKNTIQALEENDQIRVHLWDDYENAKADRAVECEECGAEIRIPRAPTAVQNQILATILKAQEQRGKLFGLFGVKQEFYLEVQRIKHLQDKLIEFMRRSLCAADKAKLADFLRGVEQPRGDVPEIPEALVAGDVETV